MEERKEAFTQEKPHGKSRNNKGLRIFGAVLLAVGFIGLGIWAAPYLMPVEQTVASFTYELGEDVSIAPEDYVMGQAWAVEKASVDLSQVQQSRVGIYWAQVRHGFQKFQYRIRIVDTTPPELTLGSGPFILEKGESYGPEFFQVEISDLSGQVSVELADLGFLQEKEKQAEYRESLCYNNTGYAKLQVRAKDASGNFSSQEVQVLVDEGPTLSGVQDFYVAAGQSVDYLEGVAGWDELDGDVTATLTVTAEAANLDVLGTYQIQYTCQDRFGFDAEQTATVHVMEPGVLQTALNTHQINRWDYRIIGAPNLYDSGYYENDDVQYIMEVMEPALVGISVKKGYWGSGFIIEINEQELIICTNQHVLTSFKNPTIYFHDGSSVKGKVAGTDYDQDIGFVTVSLEEVPEELLDTLQTVHINRTYWEELGNEDGISLCMRTIDEDGEVWRDRTGRLIMKFGALPEGVHYRSVDPITEVGVKLYSGCSGSAILDGHGNLIAMAAGHSGNRYYGISLGNILTYFEKIFGREVYYE